MQRNTLTICINPELLEKARNIVYWTNGLTLKNLVIKAIEEELKKYPLVEPRPIKNLTPGRKIV